MSKVSHKIQKEFCCIGCDYKTSKTSSWKKHIATRKHKLITNHPDIIKTRSATLNLIDFG